MRQIYLDSLKKVRDKKVDIFIGNHTANVDLVNKQKYMLEHPNENPFINKNLWKDYLDSKRNELIAMMKG